MVELGVLSSWIVFIFSQLHFFQAKLRLLPIYSAALVRHLVSKWAAACQLLFSIVMFFCHLASNRFILVMVKDGVSDSIFYHQSYMHTAFLLVSAIQTAHIAILHLAFASSSISRQKYSSKLTLITVWNNRNLDFRVDFFFFNWLDPKPHYRVLFYFSFRDYHLFSDLLF